MRTHFGFDGLELVKPIHDEPVQLTAADVLTNDWVAAANDFDHDAIKEAATSYELTEEFAGLTPPEGVGAEGAYPS